MGASSAPIPPNQGPPGPWTRLQVAYYRSWVGGFAVHGAQSAPEKRGYDQEKARFFPGIYLVFLCPGACCLSFPNWRISFVFMRLPIAGRGAGGEVPCRGVSGAAEAPEVYPSSFSACSLAARMAVGRGRARISSRVTKRPSRQAGVWAI